MGTRDPIAKWRPQLDLAHRRDPGSTSYEISNYSSGLSIGSEVDWEPGLNSENQKSEIFSLAKPHPVML